MDDVYRKRVQEGGLTIDQITVLFNHYKKREYEDFKFKALLAGAKIKDDGLPFSDDNEEKIQAGETPALFGDSKAYAHLTEDERREMTQRMIKGHRQMGLMRS